MQGACNINDPIIVGFDGKSFHFDDVGEYVMLESADGYQVRRWRQALSCMVVHCLFGPQLNRPSGKLMLTEELPTKVQY